MSIASLGIFAWAREVDWFIGLALSVGSVIGAWTGAVLDAKEWIKIWIYRILIVILIVEVYELVNKYLLGLEKWLHVGLHLERLL